MLPVKQFVVECAISLLTPHKDFKTLHFFSPPEVPLAQPFFGSYIVLVEYFLRSSLSLCDVYCIFALQPADFSTNLPGGGLVLFSS